MTLDEFKFHVLPLKNKLYAYAWRMLRNEEDARDMVQDVMLKIWEENKDFTSYRNIEAWSITLTRNKALDKMKRKDYRSQGIEEQFSLASSGLSPLNELENKDLLSSVKEIMTQLPKKQREILELRDYEECSYEEISDIMGIGISQVKVGLHRARKFVKSEMKKINAYGIKSTI